jgi:hypothetical protein
VPNQTPRTNHEDGENGFFDEPSEEVDGSRHHDDIVFIENFFHHVAIGHDPAWHFSTILQTVERAALSKTSNQLGEVARDRLLEQLGRALETAWTTLPSHYHRAQLVAGVHATWQAILHWAQPDAQRSARGGYVHDIADVMRIFRNQMHNLCLLDQIAERAKKRRDRREEIFKSMRAPTASEIAALAEQDFAVPAADGVASEGEAMWL